MDRTPPPPTAARRRDLQERTRQLLEGATAAAGVHSEAALEASAAAAFELFDTQRDGRLDAAEFAELCATLGRPMDLAAAAAALAKLDLNGDGIVDRTEFARWWLPFAARLRERYAEERDARRAAEQHTTQAQPPSSSQSQSHSQAHSQSQSQPPTLSSSQTLSAQHREEQARLKLALAAQAFSAAAAGAQAVREAIPPPPASGLCAAGAAPVAKESAAATSSPPSPRPAVNGSSSGSHVARTALVPVPAAEQYDFMPPPPPVVPPVPLAGVASSSPSTSSSAGPSPSASPRGSPRGMAAGGLLSRAELDALLSGSAPVLLLSRVHEHAEYAGWLRKEGLKWRTWKRRWFVLKQQCLFYFEQPKAPRAMGVALLAGGALVAEANGRVALTVRLGFTSPNERHSGRVYQLEPEDAADLPAWLRALRAAAVNYSHVPVDPPG